jgi:SAM-dependent methyltransferase
MGGEAPVPGRPAGPAAAPQTGDDAAAFYDRLAGVYDRRFAYPRSVTKQQTSWLARLGRPGRLLDLGCGTGRMLAPLAKTGFAPVGLDCSGQMLALARRAHPQAALVRATAERGVPFGADNFAMVVSLHAVLSHVTDPADRLAFVEEARRVLLPGGVLVLELPHPRSFPAETTPGAWRVFRPGMLCRRVETGGAGLHVEELRLEEMGGLTSRVAVIEVAELRSLLRGFAEAQLHPGFAGGRFDPVKIGRAHV